MLDPASLEREFGPNGRRRRAPARRAPNRMSAASAVCAALLGVLAPRSAGASGESVAGTFRAANEALTAGRHDEAIDLYETLLSLGLESPNLLYNLAAARWRAGHWGPAVLALERLLVLDPRDGEARRLLDEIRTEIGKARPRRAGTAGLFPRRDFLHAASARLAESQIALATIVLSFLTFGLLIARRFAHREALRLGLAIAGPASAVLLVCACVLLWSKAVHESAACEAVVLAPDVATAREGPSTGSPESFRIPEGDVVRVVGRAAGWTEVVDEAGRRGWTAPGDIGEIFGPMIIRSRPRR